MTKIVIVSKDEQFSMAKESFPSSIDVIYVKNNSTPITKVYNDFLREFRANDNVDNVIFMHADVKLDVDHLLKRIDECTPKYDMMFLAGTSKISLGHSPLNWYAASTGFEQYRWGCVTHGELGNAMSFFNSHSPEVEDHAIGVGDGLCLIFGKNALKADLWFDERLRFNCYDTQISLAAIMNCKLRLGCIVEKSLQHYSVGKQILQDDFLKDEKILREIFNIEIPPNSRLAQLVAQKMI